MVPRRFRDAYAKVIIPKPRLMMCSLKQYGGDDEMCCDVMAKIMNVWQ